MTATPTAQPERLYLMELMRTTAELPGTGVFEWIMPCYLVQTTDGQNILIDTGLPAGDTMPFLPPPEYERDVIAQLRDLGLRPEDISTVIATHLDPDHAGHHDDFPNAAFVIQREALATARAGDERNPRARARPHWDAPGLHYRKVEGDTELLPGLTLIATSGHTIGHQSVLVRLPHTGPVLLAIDAVAVGRQFVPDPAPGMFDTDFAQVRASTRKLLALAEREQVVLTVFGHDGAQWKTLKRSPEYYD